MNTKTALLAYVPVYHAGFAKFFAKFPKVKKLILIPSEILRDFGPTHKDLHALQPQVIKTTLEALSRFDEIAVADEKNLHHLNEQSVSLIIPDETALRELAKKYFPLAQITWHNIFLRWDSKKALVEKAPAADQEISSAAFDKKMIGLATTEGELSSDWWRQVGAVLCDEKNQQVLAKAHNTHSPSSHTPYINGDIRAQFHKGEHIDLTTAIHAEALLIARAAKNGQRTTGLTLYLTDFPCPTCAKLIAASGIKRIYYHTGYAMIDGTDVLKNAGVEIVQVN